MKPHHNVQISVFFLSLFLFAFCHHLLQLFSFYIIFPLFPHTHPPVLFSSFFPLNHFNLASSVMMEKKLVCCAAEAVIVANIHIYLSSHCYEFWNTPREMGEEGGGGGRWRRVNGWSENELLNNVKRRERRQRRTAEAHFEWGVCVGGRNFPTLYNQFTVFIR